MEQVEVKVGTVQIVKGTDVSDYRIVTFRGELLGFTRRYLDDRETRWREVEFYAVAEEDGGGFAVWEKHESMWENEAETYRLHYYRDFVALSEAWQLDMERAGAIPRRTLTLSEYLAEEEE